MSVPVSIRLDEDLSERVTQAANLRRWSRSQWIAWAVELALENLGPSSPEAGVPAGASPGVLDPVTEELVNETGPTPVVQGLFTVSARRSATTSLWHWESGSVRGTSSHKPNVEADAQDALEAALGYRPEVRVVWG